jgi:hypothetical protein
MINSLRVMDLVRYNVDKKCFVLSQPPKVEYWPGTDVPKSKNNVFNWRGQPSQVIKQLYPHVYKNTTHGKPFTIYSKAQASK